MALRRSLFLPYGSTMQASFTAVAVLLGIVAPALAQITPPSTRTLKVRIEATEHDKRLLLDKLQQHGREHQLECELTDENFDYRIEFQVQYMATPGEAGDTYASAKVYDSNGRILLGFDRDSRVPWGDSDARATDKVGKEIMKQLGKVPPPRPSESSESSRSTPEPSDDTANLNS